MGDRPVIFSAPMFRALLAGNKTQTRRLATSPLRRCEVGDRLYVRETWKPHSTFAGMKPRDIPESTVFYAADDRYAPSNTPWVPCIHMPRWASRLTLIVEAVKIVPLQAISEADAIAEGAAKLVHDGEGHFFEHDKGTHVCGYAGLWDHLHGSGSWDVNPDVLALTFRVVRGNINQVPA